MPNAKKQFNDILKLTKSEKSYKSISQKVDEILAKGEAERTEQLRNYYAELVKDVYKSGVNYRMAEENKPTFLGRFVDFNLIDEKLPGKVAAALKQMIAEKKPELAGIDAKFGTTSEQRRDMILSVTREISALDGLSRNGREQDIKRLNITVDNLWRNVQKRTTPTFSPDSTVAYHTGIAETYVVWKARKAEFDKLMKEKNWLWKLFNRGEIKKTSDFIHTCEKIMAATDFDPRVHGPKVEARFAAESYSFLKFHADMAEETYKSEKRAIKEKENAKSVEQLTVARDKYKNAEMLNKNPETSIGTKWKPYLDKYGISLGNDGVEIYYSAFQNAAETFDTLRDLDRMKSSIQQRFLAFYGCMVRASLKNNGTVDPQGILKDAQAMLDIELNHCTVVYEHPEAKPIADHNVYAALSDTILKKRMKDTINSYNKTAQTPISQEKIDEITKSIENIVKSDREANEKRLEELEKKEKSTESVEADQKEQTDIVKNENDMERQQVVVDLSKENNSVEMAPMIKEEPVSSKSSLEKN